MLSDFFYYAQTEQKICNSFSLQQHDRQPPSLNKLDSLRVLTGVLVLFTRDAKKKNLAEGTKHRTNKNLTN